MAVMTLFQSDFEDVVLKWIKDYNVISIEYPKTVLSHSTMDELVDLYTWKLRLAYNYTRHETAYEYITHENGNDIIKCEIVHGLKDREELEWDRR